MRKTLATSRGLGWFSIALGVTEVLGSRSLSRLLGMERYGRLLQAFGVRELAAGASLLGAPDRPMRMWNRVAGDAMDIAALATAAHPGNARRKAVIGALVLVTGITVLDIVVARSLNRPAPRLAGAARDAAHRLGAPA